MIDSDRLWNSIHELAKVGAYRDERTGLMGVNRLALTDADRDGRRLVKRWFEEAGLEVRVDRIGNVYGRRAGRDRSAAPVISGSHIDSVPTGGAFDGALGVLGALEVIRSLDDRKLSTERPLEVAFFTDEEGARFSTDMLGSAVACGRIAIETAYALTDETGVSVREELERIGFLGSAEFAIGKPHAYVECHVEQGPILAAAKLELGVVTGVQSISWQEVTIAGKSAHAGTTPMELRKDAGIAVSKIHLFLHELVRSHKYGRDMRATVGRIELVPNRVNIVPGRALCTVDLRHPEDEPMQQAEQELAAFLTSLAEELGVTIEARQTARTPRIRFSEEVQAVIARVMDEKELRHARILSGAGHDAQEFAAVCPTAMIFVPGEYEGISHNPREWSSQEACARGVSVLYETILSLAGR